MFRIYKAINKFKTDTQLIPLTSNSVQMHQFTKESSALWSFFLMSHYKPGNAR